MYYTGKCWRGRTTANAEWAATVALDNLARTIETLPTTGDPEEEQRRNKMVAWLRDIHRKPTRSKIAVILLQSLYRAEAANR